MVSSGMGGDISGKALLPAAFIHLKDPFRFRGLPVDDVHMGTCVWQGWPNGAGQMGEMSKSLDRETGIVAAWGGNFRQNVITSGACLSGDSVSLRQHPRDSGNYRNHGACVWKWLALGRSHVGKGANSLEMGNGFIEDGVRHLR